MSTDSNSLTPEAHLLKRRRQIWWLLAVLFAVACMILPLLMKGKVGSVIWITGMMACGATLGGMNHYRPWRWGVLLSIAFFLEAIFVGGLTSIFDLLDKLRFGVTLSIPAFIGTYGGAFVRKLVTRRHHLTGEPESIRFWKAAVSFGVAAGLLSLVVGSAGDVPIPSMILLLASATVIAYLKPQRLWRWMLALSPGLPLAVALRIFVEMSRYPGSHDLYPLEIGIALLYTVVPVLCGLLLGRIVKTGSISRPSTEHPSYG